MNIKIEITIEPENGQEDMEKTVLKLIDAVGRILAKQINEELKAKNEPR